MIIQWFSHGIPRAFKDGYVKSKREGQDVFSRYTSDLVIHFIYFFLMIFPGPDLILITFAKGVIHVNSKILIGFLWEQIL
jgi:hypothetical protein